MKYKIIVDKQSRTNPSNEKREYEIDIEELRIKGDIYDSLIITKDESYVIRRLSLSELHVLSVLENEVKEPLGDLNIQLFEGDNYIYLVDMTGNRFYAEYLIKNDFNDIYVTTNEMNSAINQTAQQIEFTVNQKLTGYSTTQEMNATIDMKVDEITSTVNSKFEDYSTTVQMNSAIEQKANSITSTVSETYETKVDASNTYATKTQLSSAKSEIKQTTDAITSTVSKKVGNDEIISKINQSAEKVTIDANKISLNGKEINLTSDDITIKSTNFSVDKNGNMTCKNVNVTGGTINLTAGTQESPTFKISKNNSELIAYADENSIDLDLSIEKNGYSHGTGIYASSDNNQIRVESRNKNDGSSYFISAETTKNSAILRVGTTELADFTLIYPERIYTPRVEIANRGYVMHGKDKTHVYACHWTGTQFQFFVDDLNMGTLSDKRLKTDIKKIDNDFIKAIKEVEMKQFKIDNRNGLISFGILAQDLIKIFKKYDKNPFDYEIVQEIQYRLDDETIYYTINYEQFLLLKTKAQEKQISQLEEKVEKLYKKVGD